MPVTTQDTIRKALEDAVIDLLGNITCVSNEFIKDYVESIDILLSRLCEKETIIELRGYGEENASDFFNKLKENKTIQVESEVEDNTSTTINSITEALEEFFKDKK